jgi:hypothetical protein
VRIQPTDACAANLNVDEMLVFSDRLAELRQSLAPVTPSESRIP